MRLYREQKAAGVKRPRVGRMAALAAGYGQGSWCESNAIQTADVMFCQLIKRQDVRDYLKEQGFERIGRDWYDTREADEG